MATDSNLPALTSASPTVVVSFEQMGQMAESFAKSNLFGVKTKDAALSLLMIAQAEGIHPALAVMEYDIIEGKPARKAERLLARFQMSGGKVEWLDYSNTCVKGKFSHPHGSTVTIEWTIDDATRVKFYKKGTDGKAGVWAPLSDKYNWKSWPRAMLRSRVISEGVRACFPGASLVTLTTEEAIDAQYTEVSHDEGETVEDAPEETKGFLRGAAAEEVVEEITLEMNGARSLEELRQIFDNAIKSYRGRISNNKIFGLEHVRDNVETRLEKVARQQSIAESNVVAAVLDCLPSFKELLNGINAQDTKQNLAKWASANLSAEVLSNLSEEHRSDLRTAYKDRKNALTNPEGLVNA